MLQQETWQMAIWIRRIASCSLQSRLLVTWIKSVRTHRALWGTFKKSLCRNNQIVNINHTVMVRNLWHGSQNGNIFILKQSKNIKHLQKCHGRILHYYTRNFLNSSTISETDSVRKYLHKTSVYWSVSEFILHLLRFLT